MEPGDCAPSYQRDDGPYTCVVQCLQHIVRAIDFLDLVLRIYRSDAERIGPCSNPDRISSASDGIKHSRMKFEHTSVRISFWVEQAIVAVSDSDNFQSEFARGQHCTSHDEVEAWKVTAADVD